jgi:hypothetical protein
MTGAPEKLKNVDLEVVDAVVREHLRAHYIEHPTRGPYVTSRDLYEAVEDDIDSRVSRSLFGAFCECRPYLEEWSRGYGGRTRYRILEDALVEDPS